MMSMKDNAPDELPKRPSIDKIITMRGMLEEICQQYFADGVEEGERRAAIAARPSVPQEPVAWWRTSYIDGQGNRDADVQIGATMPTEQMCPDNGYKWLPLYAAPVATAAAPSVEPANIDEKAAIRDALDSLGDDEGQGLDGYWKTGFRKGWEMRAKLAPPAATTPAGSREPADQMLREECDDADAILRALGLEPDAHRTDGGRLNVPKIRSALSRPGIDGMVDRFLGWSLPKTFRPDCGISFDGRKDDEWNKNKTWPVGTNLFNAEEARAMFEYVLAGSSAALATPTASCEAPAAIHEVRVAGPDDVVAFGDELTAHRYANNVNKTYLADRLKHPDNEVLCVATVHDRAALASPANVHQAEAATKLPDAADGAQQWIAVSDRQRPKPNTPILVTVEWIRYGENDDGQPFETTGVDVTEGQYTPGQEQMPGYFESFQGMHGDGSGVTHWMPLPPPPAASGNDPKRSASLPKAAGTGDSPEQKT